MSRLSQDLSFSEIVAVKALLVARGTTPTPAPAESGTLSGAPTAGTAGTTFAPGGTFSLLNASSSGTTAYIGLFNVTAGVYQGALLAVTGTSGALPNLTPAAAATYAIKLCADAAGATVLATSPNITVSAAVVTPTPTTINAASLVADGVTLTLTLSQAATIVGTATVAVNGVADAVTWTMPGTASATRTGTLATAALAGDTVTFSAGTGFTSPALGGAVGNLAVVNNSTAASASSSSTIPADGTLSGLPTSIVAGQPLSAATYTAQSSLYLVLYRMSGGVEEGSRWQPAQMPGGTLSLLIPQTAGAYTVRGFAAVTGGSATYESGQISVTAAPGALPATPTQTADTGATSSAVTMNWTATASSYRVLARPGVGSTYGSLADVTVSTNSYTFAGLAPSSSPRAVIIAYNANGYGTPTGQFLSFTAAAPATASAPTGVTLSSAAETSLHVSWTAPSSGPTPTAYDLALSTDGGATFVSQTRQSGDPMLYSAIFARLIPGTSYIARVTGVTGDIGTGPLGTSSANSNALSTTATTSPPNTPTSFSTTQSGANPTTNITLTWAGAVPPYVASATLTQRTPSGSGSFVPSSYTYSGNPYMNARGLTPGSSYDFQLVLTNSVGSTPAVTLTNVSTAAS